MSTTKWIMSLCPTRKEIKTPFPLMGKGRDRGAREPIKPITPTFILPRQRLCRNSKTRRTVENCKHISVENNDVIPTFASSDIQSGIASCSFPSVALLRHSNLCTTGYNTAHENDSVASPK